MRLQAEPEIGKLVGKLVLPRHVGVGHLPAADNECIGVEGQGVQQDGDVLGVMLSVGIDSQGMGVAQPSGFGKSLFERIAFAAVVRIGDYVNGELYLRQYGRSLVRAAVVYHDDIGQTEVCAANDAGYCPGIVVGGYDGANIHYFNSSRQGASECDFVIDLLYLLTYCYSVKTG